MKGQKAMPIDVHPRRRGRTPEEITQQQKEDAAAFSIPTAELAGCQCQYSALPVMRRATAQQRQVLASRLISTTKFQFEEENCK
jgi:hypothetical protein